METGSVLSEPSTGSRGFSAERSLSMVKKKTIFNDTLKWYL